MTQEFWKLYNRAKEILQSEDIDFRELGRILLKLTEYLKQELLEIFPPPSPAGKSPQIKPKEPPPPPQEPQTKILDFGFLYEYVPKVGRPAGSKTSSPKEFFQEPIPLHKSVDYVEKARQIIQLLHQNRFELKTIQDFIALLYAYQLFEDQIVEDFLNHLTT